LTVEPGPLLAILALFAGALLVPVLARTSRALAAWGSAATFATSSILLIPLAPGAIGGEVVVTRIVWLPEWGLDLAFRFDGLGLLFSILILGIGQLIILYGAYYMPMKDNLGRLFGLLLAFAGGMLAWCCQRTSSCWSYSGKSPASPPFCSLPTKAMRMRGSRHAWHSRSQAAVAWPCWRACC